MSFPHALQRRALCLGSLPWLLAACQPQQQAATEPAGPAAGSPVAVAAGPVAAPPTVRAPRPARQLPQSLFPDTLRPRLLEVTHWSDRELDSIQAHLDSTTIGGSGGVQQGRFRTLDFYDGTGTRFFYRETGKPTGWVELDLHYWLGEFNSLSFINAQEVVLTPAGPQALLLVAGGGTYGSGGGTQTNYTFIVDLAGPPTLVWKSIDYCVEEVKPTSANAQGEMEGGNFAQASRDLSVRNGLVRVPPVKRTGHFEWSDYAVTPITPGRYRYEAGRFRRVGR